jgi:TatD DNase family protein
LYINYTYFVKFMLPTPDAHAHLDFSHTVEELHSCGAVLALTLSLEEAELAIGRHEISIVWGVGCHPRKLQAQQAFEWDRFSVLVGRMAIVGEIGLDSGSRVAMDVQLKTFRQALHVVSELPRAISIHSYQATELVLEELRHGPVSVPVLH